MTTTTNPSEFAGGAGALDTGDPKPGRYGPFGGAYIPETLSGAVARLDRESRAAFDDPTFRKELARELRSFVGRTTPLTKAPRLAGRYGCLDLWLKREDLAHTGAHKINNALGQAMIAKRMGAKQVVAETGAGQHGVATAAACARIGIPCRVFMGAIDVERQAPNVRRMKLFGAEVVPVHGGDATLRAAVDEAMRAWVHDPDETFYCLGSAVGPHPYPWLVRELQSVIGREAKRQFQAQTGRLPDVVVACVGGGSNSIGMFHAFRDDSDVELLGAEAGGHGLEAGEHGATVVRGRPGVLHGSYSLLLQDADGQVCETHSISAGLDYPAVGPEHSHLAQSGRARYIAVSDDEALQALLDCSRDEGILPALETAHGLAAVRRYVAEGHDKPPSVLLCFSGRGDKDLAIIERALEQRGGAV